MPQWVLNVMVIIIVAAYGFIFSSVLDRVTKNETRIEQFNPVLMQIQTDLSAIKTNLEWLMNANNISRD